MPEVDVLFHPKALLAQEFARYAHRNQRRKYSDDPYFVHPERVARLAAPFAGNDWRVIAAAYLHDVVEDCEVPLTLLDGLFGSMVARHVEGLTDVHTKDMYPTLNRRSRKDMARLRLAGASWQVQTIKVADLIDNAVDIAYSDPGFATTYLSEMRSLLAVLTRANPLLRGKAAGILARQELAVQDAGQRRTAVRQAVFHA